MGHARNFDETLPGPEDPLDGLHADFDWPAVFGEEEGSDPARELAQRAVRALLRWLLDIRARQRRNIAGRIGLRTIGLAWVVDPSLFAGGPSLSELERRLRLPRWALLGLCAKLARELGIKNRAQRQLGAHRHKDEV